jgi:hypothetical protein
MRNFPLVFARMVLQFTCAHLHRDAGMSIGLTGYVKRYDAAGSTTNTRVALEYITNLAAGKDDDS